MSDELNKMDKEREEAAARALEAKDKANTDNTDGSEKANAMVGAVDKKGLGRVSMDDFGPEIARPSDEVLGWHVLDLKDLPSKAWIDGIK